MNLKKLTDKIYTMVHYNLYLFLEPHIGDEWASFFSLNFKIKKCPICGHLFLTCFYTCPKCGYDPAIFPLTGTPEFEKTKAEYLEYIFGDSSI